MLSRELRRIGSQGKPRQAGRHVPLFLLTSALLGTAPGVLPAQTGPQPEVRVREPTRLDWEWAARPRPALPSGYDSRRQCYRLFVPAGYKESSAWPLVLVLSAGDDALGWAAWQKPCADAGWLFAAPYGAGQ